MIKIKEMSYPYALASYLKYCYQNDEKVYIKDIEDFMSYLKANKIINEKEDFEIERFLSENRNLFTYDKEKRKVILTNLYRVDGLIRIKEVLNRWDVDVFDELDAELKKIDNLNKELQLENIRKKFIKEQDMEDNLLMSAYLYFYKNNIMLQESCDVFYSEEDIVLRSNYKSESGIVVSNRKAFTLIPNINSNDNKPLKEFGYEHLTRIKR